MIFCALLLSAFLSPDAKAQVFVAVATCGTPPATIPVGAVGPITFDTTGKLCTSGSVTLTFPTIGAAVPATGVYNAVNVAGTLRGWAGLSTGTIFPGAVAVVDASGNQITSFGGASAAVGTTGAAVPGSADYTGINVGGNLVGWTGVLRGAQQAASVQVVDASGTQITSFGSTTSNTPVAPGAATATTGTLLGCQYNTTEPAPTNGQQFAVPCGPQGELITSVPGQTNPNFAITTSNNTVTTGKSIGGLQTITNAARVSGTAGNPGTGGLIQSVVLNFKDAIGTVPMDVYFYNANPTNSTCTDNTTFVNSYTDVGIVGIAHVTDWTAGNTAATGQINNLAIPYAISSGTSIFACIVTRGSAAITNTTNANITIGLMRN